MPAAQAATIVVSAAGDADPATSTECTLRRAVLSMNQSSISGDCANTGAAFGTNDTIRFAPDIDKVTLADRADNELLINADGLTIDGSGNGNVIVERDPAATHYFRAIHIAQGTNRPAPTVTLKNLTIQHGNCRPDQGGQCAAFPFGGGGILLYGYGANAILIDSTVTQNSALGSKGGGILAGRRSKLTLMRSRVSDNTAFIGGGIYNSGELILEQSEVTGNEATAEDAVVAANVKDAVQRPNNKYGALDAIPRGGGIFTFNVIDPGRGDASTVASHSTISGNRAWFGGGVLSSGTGLALRLENATLADNEARLGGGAIAAGTKYPWLYAAHTTIAGNKVTGKVGTIPDEVQTFLTSVGLKGPDGGALFFGKANITLYSTLLSNNSAPEGHAISVANKTDLAIVGDHNLFHEAQPPDVAILGTTFQNAPLTGDPKLQPLADNGGYTRTMALGPGSAIDAAEDHDPYGGATDQRGTGFGGIGFARIVGAKADIGAFEAQAFGGCGSANGLKAYSVPTIDLCASGAAARSVSGSGPWTWSCTGVARSAPVSASCSAPLATITLQVSDTNSGAALATSVAGQSITFSSKVDRPNSNGSIVICDGEIATPVDPALPCGSTARNIFQMPAQADSASFTFLWYDVVGRHRFRAIFIDEATQASIVSAAVDLEVVPAQTRTVIEPIAAAYVPAGTPTTLTATVSPLPPSANYVPDGKITIDNVTDGTSCSIDVRWMFPHCQLTPTSVGTKVLIARYSGSARYLASESAPVMLNVGVPTASTLTTAANPSVFGQNVVVTGVVTASDATVPATGNGIRFLVDGIEVCAGSALSPSGSGAAATCALPQSSLGGGRHSVQFMYLGDTSHQPSSSTELFQVVNRAATTTALTAPDPVSLGDTVNVKASVAVTAPGAGMPTGTITISSGAGDSCTITLPATQCALTPSSIGTKPLKAVYTPDAAAAANFDASSSSSSLKVNPAAAGTALSSSANPGVYGQSVTLTATVTPARAGDPAPTGKVDFLDGGAALADCAGVHLSNAAATCVASALSTGVHAIEARYLGDANNAASSGALAQSVDKAATTLTLTPPAAVTLGNAIGVQASVAVNAPGAGAPTGTIAIGDGGAAAGDTCTITLPATQCTLTPSSGGTKTLSATYTPDAASAANFNASSASASLRVDPAQAGTEVTSSANPSVFGQSVTFTATVTARAGNPAPTGKLDFRDGAAAIAACTGVSVNDARATCTTSALSAGSHAIQASYSGDANNQASSGTLTQSVNAASTSMNFSAVPNPAVAGQTVVLTATVSANAPGSSRTSNAAGSMNRDSATAVMPNATPTGTVDFSDGAVPLGSSALDANGVATLALSSLGAGTHNLRASYSGGGYAQADAQIALVVTAAAPAVPAPSLSWWALLLLSAALACAGLRARGSRA